ncbi:hypothetical protein PM030_16075 [Halorubrum ezzemoulense]|nr:hypothetical protein [Halorubrum ezzemoulense]MDB2283381.1 hypothetical protein [Halorubrum ezzemoulense]
MGWIEVLQTWAPIIQAGAIVGAVGTVWLTYRQVKLQYLTKHPQLTVSEA